MKVFHQDRARKKRIAIGVLATSMLASALGFAPSAHAFMQPDWLTVKCGDEKGLIEAVEIANYDNDINTIVIKGKRGCDFEFSQPYWDYGSFTDNALPYIEDDLTIVGNGAEMGADESSDYSFRFMGIGGGGGPCPGPNVTLQDFTIEDFTLKVGPGDPSYAAGAGVFNNCGALTLKDMKVKDNEVLGVSFDFFGSLGDVIGGGGVATLDGSTTTRNTTISGNEVNLLNVLLADTTAVAGGIGAAGDNGPCGGDCGLDLGKTTVKGNKVNVVGFAQIASIGAGGGVAVVDDAELTMADSTVSNNSVTTKGGAQLVGIAGAGGILLDESPYVHEIARSTIKGNKAHAEGSLANAALGGGIVNLSQDGFGNPGLYVDQEDAEDGPYGTPFPADITNVDDGDKTTISDNKATCDDVCLAAGGGYTNSGIVFGPGQAVFNNTVFKGNVADGDDGLGLGGGLAVISDSPLGSGGYTILNGGSITKNVAKGTFATGGGIWTDSNNAGLQRNDVVISGNKPNQCVAFTTVFWCAN